jgi:hypothetical protein
MSITTLEISLNGTPPLAAADANCIFSASRSFSNSINRILQYSAVLRLDDVTVLGGAEAATAADTNSPTEVFVLADGAISTMVFVLADGAISTMVFVLAADTNSPTEVFILAGEANPSGDEAPTTGEVRYDEESDITPFI